MICERCGDDLESVKNGLCPFCKSYTGRSLGYL